MLSRRTAKFAAEVAEAVARQKLFIGSSFAVREIK